MSDLFIELLQVSLGIRTQLSRVPDEAEWKYLLAEAKRQSIIGLLSVAFETLPYDQLPTKKFMLSWMSLVIPIQRANLLTTSVCGKLVQQFDAAGYDVCILKGQANHRYYPDNLGDLRSSGDIDMWVAPKEETDKPVKNIIDYIDSTIGRSGLCWLHANSSFDGVYVEIHFHASFMSFGNGRGRT